MLQKKSIVIAPSNRPDWYVSELSLDDLPEFPKDVLEEEREKVFKKADIALASWNNTEIKSIGIFAKSTWDANNYYQGKYAHSHDNFLRIVAQETLGSAINAVSDGALPSNITIRGLDIGSFSMAKECELGFVYGSTIGAELAALGLPIIIFGNAGYQKKSIGIEINTKSDLDRLRDNLAKKIWLKVK